MSVDLGTNFETVVECVRGCGNDDVAAMFYDNASMWFFAQCSCSPHPYSPTEQDRLEERGRDAMHAESRR